MSIVVKLSDIIDGLESQMDDSSSFLNIETGEVILISDDEFRAVEEDKDINKFPEWQRKVIELAEKVMEEDSYIKLPSKFDIHEYSIMEKFCLSLTDNRLSNIMYNSIKGSGAFRRFKDHLHRHGIADNWYEYRDEALKQIAIEWCERKGVSFIDK